LNEFYKKTNILNKKLRIFQEILHFQEMHNIVIGGERVNINNLNNQISSLASA